jgi:hypothetical protein
LDFLVEPFCVRFVFFLQPLYGLLIGFTICTSLLLKQLYFHRQGFNFFSKSFLHAALLYELLDFGVLFIKEGVDIV